MSADLELEFRAIVEGRAIEQFYTDGQADELFALIDGKLDILEGGEVTT